MWVFVIGIGQSLKSFFGGRDREGFSGAGDGLAHVVAVACAGVNYRADVEYGRRVFRGQERRLV